MVDLASTEKIRPIFIAGCPRSGTTMLGSMLGGARGALVTPESHFVAEVLLQVLGSKSGAPKLLDVIKALNNHFRYKLWQIKPVVAEDVEGIDVDNYASIILSLVVEYASVNGFDEPQIWIDHTPENVMNFSLLKQIFPRAKFVHLIRDPRAVAASLIPLDWGPFNVRDASILWAERLGYGFALEAAYPDDTVRVKYEDIVREPIKTMKTLCDFLKIDYVDQMVSGSSFLVPAYTRKQHALVGSPPSGTRIDSWKNNLDCNQIYEIEKRLVSLMRYLDYDCDLNYSCHKSKSPTWHKLANQLKIYFKKKRHRQRKKFL